MPTQSVLAQMVNISATQLDERGLLLEEVNFKWLLAGLGWWIDMSRFQCDPSYATRFLELAEASDSPELRDCAVSLQIKRES
jgi:hypothetical protein